MPTQHPTKPIYLFLALIAIGAIGMQLVRVLDYRAIVMPAIILASTSYLLLAMSSDALRTNIGRLTLLGLICCWIGDMVGPRNFLLGLGAFLVGHLFFAAAFSVHGLAPKRIAAATLAVLLITGATAALLIPHVGPGEKIYFAAYCTVISIMLIAAAATRPGLPLALPAAAIFYASDVCVARWRYLDSNIDGYICYLLYYTACALFALNTRYAVSSRPPPPTTDPR